MTFRPEPSDARPPASSALSGAAKAGWSAWPSTAAGSSEAPRAERAAEAGGRTARAGGAGSLRPNEQHGEQHGELRDEQRGKLRGALAELALDRARPAAAIVRAGSEALFAWLATDDEAEPDDLEPGSAAERGLERLAQTSAPSAEAEDEGDWTEIVPAMAPITPGAPIAPGGRRLPVGGRRAESDAEGWSWGAVARELEVALAPLVEAHGWRGPVANWIDGLRRTFAVARADARLWAVGPRLVLLDEVGLWAGQRALDERGAPAEGPWDGEPLTPGDRLPARQTLAEHAAAALESRAVVLALGWSETVVGALRAAWRRGLAPRVVLGVGAGDGGGKRAARELWEAGLEVALEHDVALLARVPEADRVWLAAESVGGGTFVARVGSRALADEARRREVPVEILATSDKLAPGGAAELPGWGARDRWLLWESAPAEVRVGSQPYELVPLASADRFVTEIGRERAAALALRRLRTTPAPACTESVRGREDARP